MPPEQLAGGIEARKTGDSDLAVAPHLADVVQLFADMRTQWRTASVESRGFVVTGLDYTAVRHAAWLGGLRIPTEPGRRRRFFEHLKTLEVEGRNVMNG